MAKKQTGQNGAANGAAKAKVEQAKPAPSKQNVFQKFFSTILVAVLAVGVALVIQRWFANGPAPPPRVVDDFVAKGYPFEMRYIKGRGMGLFAIKDIKRGERIITEKPLFKLPTEVSELPEKLLADELTKLNASNQELYMRLGDSKLHIVRPVSIFQTNAVSTGKGMAGVCPTFSRINHACLGGFNVVYNWREAQGDITVQAVKDIKAGEEILTSYTDTLVPRAERREYLKKVYKFTCKCAACSRSDPESAASDARMREHKVLMDKLATWSDKKIGGKEAIEIAKKIYRIRYEEEQPEYGSNRAQLLADMAQISAAHRADMATVHYSEGAAKWYGAEIGHDTPQFTEMVKVLSLGPAMHKHHGTRDREDIEAPGAGAF